MGNVALGIQKPVILCVAAKLVGHVVSLYKKILSHVMLIVNGIPILI